MGRTIGPWTKPEQTLGVKFNVPTQPTKYVNCLPLLLTELGPGRLTQVKPVGARQADQLA